jgi:drug/metabolite transporter (DMT)-like permease
VHSALPALVWVVLVLIWGSTWLAVGLGLLDLPPFTFAGLRFLAASGVLFGVLAVRGAGLPRRLSDWALMVLTSVFGFVLSYSAMFWGVQFVPSGLAAVIFSTVPLFTLVIAHVALPGEPMRPGGVVGVVVGVVGVAVIFSDQLGAENPLVLWGSLGFLAGSACMAGAHVAVKARGTHLDPMTLAAVQMGLAGAFLLAVGLVTEGNPLRLAWTGRALLSLAYLALVGSALGFFLFYWLLRHMAVTKTMSMMLLHPVVAIVLGALVLGETLGWRALAGSGGILMGLSLLLWGSPAAGRASGERTRVLGGGGSAPPQSIAIDRAVRPASERKSA